MAGTSAPQILTLTYFVGDGFNLYVNVSFPYRAKVTKVWFTTDDDLAGSWEDERVARLGGIKSRNARYAGDEVSDWAPFFGGSDAMFSINEDLKPVVWLGNPDLRPEGLVVQEGPFTTGYRSTVGVPAPSSTKSALVGKSSRPYAYVNPQDAENDANNPYWYNWGWSDEPEYLAKRYKSDQGILNPDEVLSLFIYADGGDWGSYPGPGLVTIFVEYADASGADDSAPTRLWD